VFGTCGEFNVLLNDKIPTTLITQTPVSVTLFSMSGAEIMGMNDPSDLFEVEQTMRSVRCEEPGVVSTIVNDLRSLSSSTPSPSATPAVRSHDCGSDEWSVIRCDGPFSLVLCVNCTNRTSNENYCDLRGKPSLSNFPFSISCVDTPEDSVGHLSILYLEFNELSPPPSFLSTEVIQVSDTNVTVEVVMSASGSVTCAAFLTSLGTSPSSSEMFLLLGGDPVIGTYSALPFADSSTVATYTLVGLTPSSRYDIYCASLSPSSVLMPTVEMLRSKLTVKTACCRVLFIRLSQHIVDDVSTLGFALTLDVGTVRVDDLLNISITATEVRSFVNRILFVPSSIMFSSSSSSLKADLTYIPVMSGSYRLNVTLTGPSSSTYTVVFPFGDMLVVKGVEEVLPPPLILQSEFSSDGSKIKVTFTSPTNRAGVVNLISCGLLFKSSSTTTSHSLPWSSRCLWTSDSSLEISSFGSFIEPGDVLTLKTGVLKARCTSKVDPFCGSWKTNDPQNSTISVISTVMSPVVTLSLPTEIGPCDDLTVDLTSSSGAGGRSWKSVSFVVGGSPNTTSLQSYLSMLSMDPAS
jgi:hypothetical protein